MATARQAGEILERRLGLPTGRLEWHATRLRTAGLLPSAQGKPTELTADHVATLFLSAIVGSQAADDTANLQNYLALRADGWTRTLGEALAHYLQGNPGLYELRLDLAAPGATLLVNTAGFVMPESYVDDTAPRPAYHRTATIAGSLINQIAHDIINAPPVRAGRRARKDQYRA